MLAKEVATLDVLSGGRVEFGIGAGWMNTDYEQSGIQHDRAGVRIDRLAESLEVFKAIFAGEHRRLHRRALHDDRLPGLPEAGADAAPADPHRRRRQADADPRRPARRHRRHQPEDRLGQVDTPTAQNGAADRTDQKMEWVREAAGDRYDDIELNMLVFAFVVTDDAQGTIDMLAPMFGLDPAEVADYPLAWIGTEDEIVEALQARRERWDVSYLVVQQDAMEAAAPIVARLRGT